MCAAASRVWNKTWPLAILLLPVLCRGRWWEIAPPNLSKIPPALTCLEAQVHFLPSWELQKSHLPAQLSKTRPSQNAFHPRCQLTSWLGASPSAASYLRQAGCYHLDPFIWALTLVYRERCTTHNAPPGRHTEEGAGGHRGEVWDRPWPLLSPRGCSRWKPSPRCRPAGAESEQKYKLPPRS